MYSDGSTRYFFLSRLSVEGEGRYEADRKTLMYPFRYSGVLAGPPRFMT